MSDFLTKIKRFILYAGDVILLYGVLAIVLMLRYGGLSAHVWQIHFWPFSIMFALWLLTFYISGLYDPRLTKNDINFYTLIFKTLALVGGIGMVYFYISSSRLFSIRPFIVFFVYLAIFSVLFLFWRRFYNHLTETQTFRSNVLFIGGGQDMDNLIAELNRKPHLGYHVAERIFEAENFQNHTLGDFDLKKLLTEKRIDTVVTSLELHRLPEIVSQFYKNLFLGISYFDLPTFYERVLGKIPVTTIGQMWFLENISEGEKRFYEIFKRISDILISLILGIAGLLLTPFIALAIKLDSKGPVLFKQNRVGRGGQIFRAMKFRSMVVGAEKNGAQWATANDPRITRVGRFLRKSRLDEIPQLLNVLRGEMSFVGPRPERPEFVEELKKKIPFYDERHLIKPGLTGWAQVNFKYGASENDALEKLQYDLYYIKNRSILLDLGIALKTINIVLSGKGQ